MSRRWKLAVLPWLYRAVATATLATCRVVFLGRDRVEALERAGRTWVFVAWHETTGASVALERGKRLAMMASDSRDGEYIARGIELLGNIAVRGSSSKGGAKAVKAMTKWLRSGHSAAVTPDGPRGPRRVAQPGVLWIGALSGAPLVPYHVVATRQWVLERTWDRHRFPKPFSTVYVAIGEPFAVDRQRLQADEAGTLAELSARMAENAATAERAAALQ
jgi:lysophospholipid acyltransferase (LPLAT)-like uncharacterized protein